MIQNGITEDNNFLPQHNTFTFKTVFGKLITFDGNFDSGNCGKVTRVSDNEVNE